MRINPWLMQLIALVLIGLLFIFAVPFFANYIKTTLQQEVQTVLNKNQMDWVAISVSGRDLTLEGQTDTLVKKNKVFHLLRDISGIGHIKNNIEVSLHIARPYLFKAIYKKGQLLLSGHLPNKVIKMQFLKKTQKLFPSNVIKENLKLARGQPQQWHNILLQLLLHLREFKQASIEVSDYNIRLTGSIDDNKIEKLRQLNTVLQNNNYILQLYINTNNIELKRVTPYTFNFSINKNEILLTGYMPNKVATVTLLKNIKKTFKNKKINNQLLLAQGQPKQWQVVLDKIVTTLKPLKSGNLDIINYDIRLTGIVKTKQQSTQLKQKMQQLQSFNYHNYLYIKAEDERILICQQKFNQILNRGKINFFSGKKHIKQESDYLLLQLKEVAMDCPEFNLEITGHTDGDGNSNTNQYLSQERANAVANRLHQLGIKKSRLTAIGYGESKPIADNQSSSGKAKNRRIEFIVKVEK